MTAHHVNSGSTGRRKGGCESERPPFDISNWDGDVSTLPPLAELNVHPGTLAAAESIVCSFDEPSIDPDTLEWLIVAIVLFERLQVSLLYK